MKRLQDKKTMKNVLFFMVFCYFLLWKLQQANMICLEPWLNLPDTVGERKEFFRKAGVVCVPPKGKKIFMRKITYYE